MKGLPVLWCVNVYLAFGTGGLRDPQQYWSGVATGYGLSRESAERRARKRALKKCGEGASWVPIMDDVDAWALGWVEV